MCSNVFDNCNKMYNACACGFSARARDLFSEHDGRFPIALCVSAEGARELFAELRPKKYIYIVAVIFRDAAQLYSMYILRLFAKPIRLNDWQIIRSPLEGVTRVTGYRTYIPCHMVRNGIFFNTLKILPL